MRGRPTIYAEDLASALCERLAAGETLSQVCLDEAMPGRSTVYEWLEANEAFRARYARARDIGADAMFDELLEIADDASGDVIHTEHGPRLNAEFVARSKLRVDARKWMLAKAAPTKYGERSTTVHEGGDKPIETRDVTQREHARRIAFALAKAARETPPET